MFPGFIVSYKDENKYIHLYFFPGIDDDGECIYNPIELKKGRFKYSQQINEDGSVDFKFENKHIIELHCILVERKTNIYTYETLVI